MHNPALAKLGLDWRYLAFEVSPDALGKAIEVGRDGVRVAVAAEMRAVIFAGDPENVGQRLLRSRLAKAKRGNGTGQQEYSTDSAHD